MPYNRTMPETDTKQILQLRVPVFPLGEELNTGEYKIADHVNLTGTPIKGLGFIPITDLYVDKNNKDAIFVACLKAGQKPSEEEAKVLLENGIKAYTYELVQDALQAAAVGKQVEATAYFPKLPSGFRVVSGAAQIKESGKSDVSVLFSESEAIWAGTFTTNQARAACVENNIKQKGFKVKAIFCNAGNANACTGEAGNNADKELRCIVSKNFDCDPTQVLTASTGKIGVVLDTSKIASTLSSELDTSIKGYSEAILTTDLVSKISQDDKANFLAFAKGSGMIHPNMATMLCFVASDKKIQGLSEQEMEAKMQEIVSQSVDESFNSITVDGDTSTNDMVLLMNNMQGEEISEEEFKTSLGYVLQDLAKKIVRDGEGATKFIELEVQGHEEARKLARSIMHSALVKTAFFGNDPNWGRMISACGQAAAENKLELNFKEASLEILGVVVYQNGIAKDYDRDALANAMAKSKDIQVKLVLDPDNLNSAKVWASDLSYEYVRINAEYFT